MPDVQAMLLTGGASSRMGTDKATLDVDGVSMAERIARALLSHGVSVTVLGPEPVMGLAPQPDPGPRLGPAAALAACDPSAQFVFVCAADIPRFDARVVDLLLQEIGDADAAVPLVEGNLQVLCALYRAQAFGPLRESVAAGRRSLMAWCDRLRVVEVTPDRFAAAGVPDYACLGANTPGELADLLGRR